MIWITRKNIIHKNIYLQNKLKEKIKYLVDLELKVEELKEELEERKHKKSSGHD